jgi:hypothetical protein
MQAQINNEQNKLFRSVAQNVKNAAICTITYALFLAGGTFLLLVVVSAIGYLPYSDRRGPGWYAAHIPNVQEVGYYASWATLSVLSHCFGGFYSSSSRTGLAGDTEMARENDHSGICVLPELARSRCCWLKLFHGMTAGYFD